MFWRFCVWEPERRNVENATKSMYLIFPRILASPGALPGKSMTCNNIDNDT